MMQINFTPPSPSPHAVAASLRARLRLETAADHGRVDAVFGALDLTERHDYARFLMAHEWAMRAVEVQVPDMPRTRSLLRDDLASLGHQPLDRDASRALEGTAPLGIAYVIGGAHFGAAVLRRRVGASSDPTVREASSYLGSDAMRDAWRDIRSQLETRPASGKFPDDVVRAARLTFALFHEGLVLSDEGGKTGEQF